MPVWGQVISGRQVDALVAYLHAGLPAVAGATAVAVQTDQGPVVEGQQLYVRYGCINCHGPNGLGGVPNPQSPDKAIPALSGADFFQEFNTDAKIIDVIRSGSVLGTGPDRLDAALGRHPLGRAAARPRRLHQDATHVVAQADVVRATGTRVSSRPVAARSAETIAAVETTVGGSPTPFTP